MMRAERAGAWAACLILLLAPRLATGADPLDDFDHIRTGFPLTGGHERIRCESCHLRGIFEGTPTQCGVCHSVGGVWQAGGKPLNHVPSPDQCGDCHVTATWTLARFDHAGITASCIQCHNGSVAEGKPPFHVPSSNDCEVCHGTLAWSPAGFDHSLVTGSCFSCHNGTFATGKPGNHVPSTNLCEDCHTTTTWETAGGFDHAGITTNCVSCHDGRTATGKGLNHIASSNACETCHDTRSWASAGFDHSGVTGNCRTCHDGSRATGPGGNHFVTSLDCNACHSTDRWVPISFQHTSPAYPGDHAGSPDCSVCHRANSETVAWPFAAFRPDCAGCHAGDFETGPHKKVDSPRISYTVSELRDCTGACHIYTDSTFTTIERRRSGEHRVNRGDW